VPKTTSGEQKCSFCGAPAAQVKALVQGINEGISICGDCVDLCAAEIADAERKTTEKIEITPKAVLKHLNQYVVGQDEAKKILAVAIYNHYKRVFSKLKARVSKSNVFLIGPSGTGKTLLVEKIADYLDLPFAIVDATTITEAGYVGEDPEMMLARLIQSANGNLELAEKGIIYIDEADKLAKRGTGGQRDIKGEGVQQSLLKMIEGDVVAVNPNGRKKNSNDPVEYMNTKDILFILGGAFVGLKQNGAKRIGIGADHDAKEKSPATTKDLVDFGMIPELVGRVPVIAELDQLTVEQMVRVLVEPKDSLTKQYQALLAEDAVSLKFEGSFLREIAERAMAQGTGARGLRSIMESALLELMFEAPERKKKNRADLAAVKGILGITSLAEEVWATTDLLKPKK
jgi:ATP-dependent Clp protease ATP-binding subunit ClpX